jgi:hypothetical protein
MDIISISRIRGAPGQQQFQANDGGCTFLAFPGRRGEVRSRSSQKKVEEDRVGITDAGQDDEFDEGRKTNVCWGAGARVAGRCSM